MAARVNVLKGIFLRAWRGSWDVKATTCGIGGAHEDERMNSETYTTLPKELKKLSMAEMAQKEIDEQE